MRLTVVELPVEELLSMVRVPVAAPAVVGSNSMLIEEVGFEEFSVSGKVGPEKEKPVPLIVMVLTVTGAVPDEVKVKDCVAGVFKVTSPKAMLLALMLSVAMYAFSCRAKFSDTVPALAVKVTACAVDTAETVAEKLPVVEPAATVTDAGTVTAELLLARFTVNPPVAAAGFKVTVQASVPEPVMEEFVQETAISVGTSAFN